MHRDDRTRTPVRSNAGDACRDAIHLVLCLTLSQALALALDAAVAAFELATAPTLATPPIAGPMVERYGRPFPGDRP
jgi:hypothetical protein